MLQKYIVATVTHNKKNYAFHRSYLRYDKNVLSLDLDDEYLKSSIERGSGELYSIFEGMKKEKLYSCDSSIYRAIRNGTLTAEVSIIFITNSNNYKSSLECIYSIKDKIITIYEIAGHSMMGKRVKKRTINFNLKF